MNVAVHDAKMALGVFLGLLVASSLGLLVLGPITYNKQITLNEALAQQLAKNDERVDKELAALKESMASTQSELSDLRETVQYFMPKPPPDPDPVGDSPTTQRVEQEAPPPPRDPRE